MARGRWSRPELPSPFVVKPRNLLRVKPFNPHKGSSPRPPHPSRVDGSNSGNVPPGVSGTESMKVWIKLFEDPSPSIQAHFWFVIIIYYYWRWSGEILFLNLILRQLWRGQGARRRKGQEKGKFGRELKDCGWNRDEAECVSICSQPTTCFKKRIKHSLVYCHPHLRELGESFSQTKDHTGF